MYMEFRRRNHPTFDASTVILVRLRLNALKFMANAIKAKPQPKILSFKFPVPWLPPRASTSEMRRFWVIRNWRIRRPAQVSVENLLQTVKIPPHQAMLYLRWPHILSAHSFSVLTGMSYQSSLFIDFLFGYFFVNQDWWSVCYLAHLLLAIQLIGSDYQIRFWQFEHCATIFHTEKGW